MDEKQIAISISTKLKDASTKELKDYADQLSRIQAFSKGLDKGALKQIDSSADGLKDNNKQLEQIAKNTRKSFGIQGITAFLRREKTGQKAGRPYIYSSPLLPESAFRSL